MDSPDGQVSNVTGWLAAATLASKLAWDWIAGRKARRAAGAEGVNAATAADQSVFKRAKDWMDEQEKIINRQVVRIDELEQREESLRAEILTLRTEQRQFIEDNRAHVLERIAWKTRETFLEGRIVALTTGAS